MDNTDDMLLEFLLKKKKIIFRNDVEKDYLVWVCYNGKQC